MEIGEGRYRLIRRVGAGGAGVVYQAADRVLGRTVAIKALLPSIELDLLRREGQAMAQISHPNVVALHDILEDDGRAFLVLEYVDGCSLQQWLADNGPLPVPQALTVFRRVAGAVRHAHMLGLLHCDLKPANVLLSSGGAVKLTDFTLARLRSGGTYAGAAGGSAAFAAPEQMRGDPVDARTDVYGLGALLARMVGPPGHSTDDGRWLAGVIDRATAADADHRFPSVDAMLDALPGGDDAVTNVAARPMTSELTRVTPAGPLARPSRRSRALWALSLLPTALIVAAVALLVHLNASAAPPTVAVPNLVSLPQASAQQVARSLLLSTRVTRSYSPIVAAGEVISQRPLAQSRAVKGSTISLVVSDGPRPVSVPRLDGLSGDDAMALLRRLGFRVEVQTEETVWHYPGQVREQTPNPGALRLPGSIITITVSKRPWWWPIP